jgi:hypothetical protein
MALLADSYAQHKQELHTPKVVFDSASVSPQLEAINGPVELELRFGATQANKYEILILTPRAELWKPLNTFFKAGAGLPKQTYNTPP